ncbi:MAG TPA: hypothetical protein VK614_14955 [Allosphingosinicella sp.]|nr:hypothetical protein [Allosphingosinicella sp.]
MLKQRRGVAIKVRDSLFAAEEAIDAALARTADLNSKMVTARTDAGLSALVGQDVFEVAASAFAALARARCDIVETHKRLSEAKIQVGLRTIAIGDLGKPPAAEQGGDTIAFGDELPKPPMPSVEARHLQGVAVGAEWPKLPPAALDPGRQLKTVA